MLNLSFSLSSIKFTQYLYPYTFYQVFVTTSVFFSYQDRVSAQALITEELSGTRNWYILIGIMLLITVITMLLMQTIRNRRLARKLEKLATIDDLTGLMNRRQILECVETQLTETKARGESLSLALVDIDWFKQINDKFGYFTGDKVLKLFSELCVENLSEEFLLGRIGEEEFLIIMPDTHRNKAYLALEHLRRAMREVSEKVNMPDLDVTLSAGICEYKESDTSDIMLQLASTALYRAKENSRNIVVVCDRSDESGL
ncbi:GGDEF domain-containing protein [Paraglaciecola marina]|uniref:GGDEF domain-containing protein n=1 Tax=Paraglaciecola marina TaxID=2500157 RepID=UPI00105D2C8A|nr:GGDEF domain-containing protein [Paraglaciecola marina]